MSFFVSEIIGRDSNTERARAVKKNNTVYCFIGEWCAVRYRNAELLEIAADIGKLRVLKRKLWYERSKPFGFEKVNSRLSDVETLTLLAHDRLEEYLQ